MKHVNVVCALIKNEKNEIFVCKRGPGRVLCGKWEFPGGKIEQGETKEETIIREIKEELDSLIEPYEYLGVSEYEYTDIDKPFSITLYGYLCKLKEGKLILSEHTESKWVKIDELAGIDFATADIPFIYLIK